MPIVEIFEILSQEDGSFVGCCEIKEGRHFADLWDESGDYSTLMSVEGLCGERLYRAVVHRFVDMVSPTRCMSAQDIYLTDAQGLEILWAE